MPLIHEWSNLTRLQLGKYAEYFVKMEFTMRGFDVYSAEVDDKGIDFVIRKNENKYYDIQVKSARDLTYVFIPKDKCEPRNNFLISVVLFTNERMPSIYLIPTIAWRQPNDLFVDRDYEGKKSKPEWGLNLSQKNLTILKNYSLEKMVTNL
jgi:hypothetical protein